MNKVSRFVLLFLVAVSYPIVLAAQEEQDSLQEVVSDAGIEPDSPGMPAGETDAVQISDSEQSAQVEPEQEPISPQEQPAPEEPSKPGESADVEKIADKQADISQEIELGPDEVVGIDTVDLEDPQGNWLYKRVWWERAEAKYEKIRAEVGKIMESRTGFFARRADLDKNVLDPFYIKIGLSQGELQEILKGLIEKAESGIKTEKNEEILEKAQEDKKALEKLQADVKNVQHQDEELENAVMTLVNQISKLRAVEQQAWQDFKGIARVLDDRKARELFYKVDNGWRNVQELSSYLQGSFSSSFDQLIERIKTLVTNIDAAVATLKEKGVELKNRANEPVQEEQEEQEQEPKSMLSRYVIDPVSGFFSGMWSIIRWPYDAVMSRFGSSSAEQENDEPDVEVAPEDETIEPVPAQELVEIAIPASAASMQQQVQIAPAEAKTLADRPALESQNYDIDEDQDMQNVPVSDDSGNDSFDDFADDDSDFAPMDQLQESVGDEE